MFKISTHHRQSSVERYIQQKKKLLRLKICSISLEFDLRLNCPAKNRQDSFSYHNHFWNTIDSTTQKFLIYNTKAVQKKDAKNLPKKSYKFFRVIQKFLAV